MSNQNVEVVQKAKTPSELIEFALRNKGNLKELETLLGLQERYEANEARKMFAASFANAQRDIEAVIKTKTNRQTSSMYADLGDVIETAKPAYTKEGFSVIFYEGDTVKPEHIRIFVDVLHSAGHKETYHLDIPMDGKGLQGNANMTKIHAMASSIAYGRRYLMCMIWNIPTADDDGNAAAAKACINEWQIGDLRDLLKKKEWMSEAAFLKYMNVAKIENIKASDYKKAENAINNAKKKEA